MATRMSGAGSGPSGAPRDLQRRRAPRMFLITSDLKVQDQLEGTIRLEQGHMCLEMPPESGGPRDQVWVKVIDNGLMVKLERHFLMEVPGDVCGLLEPVTDPGTRFNLLLNDPGKLQRLAAVPLGTRLWAQIGQPDELAEAELRHRGPLTRGSSCVLFGVQLKGSAVGRGLSNGSYKGHQLFVCPEASALFLPVSHVRLRQWSSCGAAPPPGGPGGAEPSERVVRGGGGGEPREPPRRRSDNDGADHRVVREPREPRRSEGNGYPAPANNNNHHHSQQNQNQNPTPPAGRSPQHRSALQPLNRTADSASITAQGPTQGPAGSFQARGGPGAGPGSPPLFREGDRVCFPLEHTVQGGEVRYCGPLPGRSANALFVGILLDAPVGNWDGFYKGDKLCHMPSPLYGELLPIAKVSHESKAHQINPRSVLKAMQLPPIPKPSPVQHVPKPGPAATSPQYVPKTNPATMSQQHVPKPTAASQHVPKPTAASQHVPVNLRVALMPPQLGSPQRHAPLKAPPPLPPPKPATLAPPPPLPPPKPQATPLTTTDHHHQSRPSNGTHGPASPLHSPAGGGGGGFGEENGGGGGDYDLEAGSMVEVNDPPLFGVIRWIGRIGGVPELVAGIELDSELSAGTDGSYLGERHFRCPVNKGLFVKLRNCRRDSRFPAPETRLNQVERCNSIAFAEWGSERVEEHTPPTEQEDEAREVFCGWKRGIQGHLNSCYLDSTLFSLFSCCSAADWVLLYPMAEEDGLSSQAQDLLRCEIVNPLRRFGYVCASKTMALRRLLEADSTSDTGFTNQEKDPEEFLNRLFQLLQIEPLLKIRSTNQQAQEFHLYQLFPPPLPPSPPSSPPPASPSSSSSPLSPSPSAGGGRLRVASVQTLLESSFHHAGLKFVEAPSCLLLLMPRFGRDFKMFDAILPSLGLDITDLLEDTLRQCSICQSVAEWECLQCYEDLDITPGHLKQYCHTCNTQVHSHRKRASHAPQRVGVPEGPWEPPPGPLGGVARQRMALFAVTCIETSHYVSFVKHGPRPQDWLFFDSMADREGGENGFNVPQVRACPEVGRYLSLSEEELSRVDPASLREPARRLLCDAHLCFYHSPELTLYK